MATAVVGGAFLSAFLDVVFDRLASPEVVNFIRGNKLHNKLLQQLETILRVVRAVLDDAEKKQITDSSVNEWLTTLKDLVYQADDLLDHVSTKAATQKKVRNFFSRFSNRKIITKLEDIVVRLEIVLRLKESLDLKEIAVENSVPWKVPSTSLEDGSHIYGRDDDKEAIIKLLLENSSDGEEVSVIPIVGMGGVGKTTLAQLVYNDNSLKEIFDFKAWVCVSEEFDILNVTKIISEAVTAQPCKINDLNLLHLELVDKLKDKKFLIVLDDVWLQDYVNWSLFKKPLQRGIKGSKILVTTRNESVAIVVGTVQAYHLNQLSNEDCWLVFANHACFTPEPSENSRTLEKIGRDIVKKCKGLPLAVQSLGGMLRRKHDARDWNDILNSDIWELECNIIPALRISYHYLPPQLKRCFVYCSLYPKDYEFQKNELILLWMAEDLLKPGKTGKSLEEVGCEYFDYLVSRSFFQHSRNWTWKNDFVMHDLMHDLATSLGREFYLRSEEMGKETKIDVKIRHLSFTKFSHDVLDNFDGVKFLRTFLSIIHFESAPFHNEKAPCIIMSKLLYLRVLSFCDFQSLDALPDSIGKLIHLCYLNLSRTSVSTLPESLCNLYNLETLKLYNCTNLTMLPNGMQNLVNLRHLDIYGVPLKEMPRGMGKLNHLQQLDFFIVGKNIENGIKELGGLSNLHGSLMIRNLENVTSSDEALEAKIMDKKYIDELSLKWSECNDNSSQFQTETDVLCKLQPHQELKSLSIRGYQGTRFSDWVGNCLFHCITDLRLYDCKNCCMLPSLGQLPSLKNLCITRLNSVKTIDAGFYNNENSCCVKSFPSLEVLEIDSMPCWEVWSSFESDAFSSLRRLVISDCPKLRGDLPNHLPALESLTIAELPCWEMWCSFESCAFPLLKDLDISDCPKLRGDLPNHLPALERLEICNCEQLVSTLPRAPVLQTLNIYKSNKVALDVFPPSVKFINVKGSPMVESMIEAITSVQPTSLHSLLLSDSSSAISFPGGRLPASLKTLIIHDIKKLEFPSQHKHELLESLNVYNSCDSLTSLPLITFPNLKRLIIDGCENMESLLVSVSESPKNLSYFVICRCPNFVSFPREGSPAPNLNCFRVGFCDKLKSLPTQMSALLPKLEHIYISNCPEIESFPEGGMPPNLSKIEISNCEKLVSGLAWPSMDMLTDLIIGGPCDGIKSFPKEGLLPLSLTSLSLRNLSSLEMLDCKGLLHLTSLQKLEIFHCHKLENMAGERLPLSLIKLQIILCPLLQKRVKHRQIWPKISHIPGIKVDDRWI
ncbi:putative disease resistance RPP13-like protein 1 [Cajanus cajan]|uniref:putative disease resistance RPP13-like protein 1 n=1 Tax=Cajanus cajan TaxID=3821 RepID=UPI00098DBD78|nr:putative disease resistance RPP13-like protein 1 [Cajanus cajan]XP_029127318.1 putative disease resistance RPP13-like protein 1 [Cajanus cajan]